jgi:3-oxoacyl-[acyl-carrier-protein] synthase II
VTERRAVVTGVGIVSPVGIGADTAWDALVSGRSGIDRITLFDPSQFEVDVAGEVKGFDVTRTASAWSSARVSAASASCWTAR